MAGEEGARTEPEWEAASGPAAAAGMTLMRG